MQNKAKSAANTLVWWGLVLLSFGTLWVLKFTIQRGVEDGINNTK